MRKPPALSFLISALLAFATPLAQAAASVSSAPGSMAASPALVPSSIGEWVTTNPNATAGVSTAAGTVAAEVPAEVIGGGYYGGGTAVALSPGLSAGTSDTPLLDQATINAERQDERRRASGEQPRIIGIAPRTNADRTDEMPDDPIIRY